MSDYLIDHILPKREIHLLGGPSGAGKTRWLLPMLLDWQKGLPVLGFESFPSSWAYLACDRGKDSICRTLESMNIPAFSIPLISVWDDHLKWVQILEKATQSKAELIVIESFGSFIEGLQTGTRVKHHISDTYRNLCQRGKTVIGIVESPKQKGGTYDRYENPRQRISGAAAWAHFTETVMLVEPSDLADPACASRQLYVCPRNGPTINRDLAFDEFGHLRTSKFVANL